MKRLFILILLTVFLSGCGIFNLNGFIMPDDLDFLAVVESLDTPEKICGYMKDNFIYKYHSLYAPNPYTLWKTKEGDCNDFSTFGVFVANYHGYTTYQIDIKFNNKIMNHYLAVYVENNGYTFSSNMEYYPWICESFIDVIKCYTNNLKSYKVYDYDMNLIEEGK